MTSEAQFARLMEGYMRAKPSIGVLGIIRWNDGGRWQGPQQQNAYYRLVGNFSRGPSRSG